MKVSKAARRDAKQLLRSCFVGGVLDESCVRQAVTKVLEARPRGYQGILAHFQRLLKLELDRRTARVETPVPLKPELRSQIEAGLERQYGPGLSISFGENPALLGGLRIKVGSDVYDGSVQAKLRALEQSF